MNAIPLIHLTKDRLVQAVSRNNTLGADELLTKNHELLASNELTSNFLGPCDCVEKHLVSHNSRSQSAAVHKHYKGKNCPEVYAPEMLSVGSHQSSETKTLRPKPLPISPPQGHWGYRHWENVTRLLFCPNDVKSLISSFYPKGNQVTGN